MDERLLLFLVLFALLSVAGVAFIWIGLSGIRKARVRAERERARASGMVVDMVKHLSLGRGRPLIAWHPVVEFRTDGSTVRLECRTGCRSERIRVGKSVDILYDADDPSHFHLEEQSEWETTGDRITVVVGIVWIAVAGIVAFCVSR